MLTCTVCRGVMLTVFVITEPNERRTEVYVCQSPTCGRRIEVEVAADEVLALLCLGDGRRVPHPVNYRNPPAVIQIPVPMRGGYGAERVYLTGARDAHGRLLYKHPQ